MRNYTGHTTTYNLTVTDLHTYYVLAGTTPVLVHNGGDGDIDPRFVIPDWDEGDGDDDGHHTTADRETQNKQARDALKEVERKIGRPLSRAEKRIFHDAITKRGLDYDGIVNEATHLFGEGC
ncbi:hypothetical protein [Streptomyces sp. CBMA29]|uniref:hypothetical protein n=1 Tax=Streptomyces sp. CBMA29 TaxID=1896314 RepID=UPI002948C432|nr:hypothetical protein [Streptomyces sp. CBMA29]